MCLHFGVGKLLLDFLNTSDDFHRLLANCISFVSCVTNASDSVGCKSTANNANYFGADSIKFPNVQRRIYEQNDHCPQVPTDCDHLSSVRIFKISANLCVRCAQAQRMTRWLCECEMRVSALCAVDLTSMLMLCSYFWTVQTTLMYTFCKRCVCVCQSLPISASTVAKISPFHRAEILSTRQPPFRPGLFHSLSPARISFASIHLWLEHVYRVSFCFSRAVCCCCCHRHHRRKFDLSTRRIHSVHITFGIRIQKLHIFPWIRRSEI